MRPGPGRNMFRPAGGHMCPPVGPRMRGPKRGNPYDMRQLTALDQQFLALEDARHYGHVGALAVLDPSRSAAH
ncbi:MAG TPA: hypothetical protein VFB39_10955 [Solirubrobacteraceae bacterium]|nr:hypothetical protein [Solirubrobacteraceae bacterium]